MDVTRPRAEAGPYAAWRLAMELLVVFIGLLAALQVDANFSWWREQPIQVEMALQPFAEYYSDDTKRVPSTSFAVGTECRRIHYNFGQLRSEHSRMACLSC